MFCPHQALPGNASEGLCTLAAPSPLHSPATCSQQNKSFPCAEARELISLSNLPLWKGWVTFSPLVSLIPLPGLRPAMLWNSAFQAAGTPQNGRTWICATETQGSDYENSCFGFKWAALPLLPQVSPSHSAPALKMVRNSFCLVQF